MDESTKIARVIVDITHQNVDRLFDYIIPAHIAGDIRPGVRVNIPFGKGNRLINGYVVEVSDKTDCDVSRLKAVDSVETGSIPIESQLIALAWYIKERYGSTMNKALKTVMPVKREMVGITHKIVRLEIDAEESEKYVEMLKKRHATAKLRLTMELIGKKELPYEIITDKLNISAQTVKAMENDGIISIEVCKGYGKHVTNLKDGCYAIKLNEVQQKIVDDISAAFCESDMRKRIHLIHGVTGSGKTEIYIELIDRVIKTGREVIMLIPEIALTYQTVMRFYEKFGDKVSFINSKMSAGEKYDRTLRAGRGEISVMIGPRSALFSPFKNLGLIVIDEEHENSYKSESVPRYDGREVAIRRAMMAGASVVLGSATPSVDSYYLSQKGEYVLHELNVRATGREMPDVDVVDMRRELAEGNKSMFSAKLSGLIKEKLAGKEQIMLFINRRGYAGFVSCRKCGHVIKCPHCDVSLTAHGDGRLRCHYCGCSSINPKICPKCGSKYIGLFGTGTEKVEEAVKKQYPEARVLRMDMDTTSKKGGHEKILSAFANREADILIGTQMIVKGHDFPMVTLVGIIAADLSLYSSDYRASERTFQLLTQAAGRAGRGGLKGSVVIQTYNPENFSIVAASKQNYKMYYNKEIEYRKLLGYPPANTMTAVIIASHDDEKAAGAGRCIRDIIARLQKKGLFGTLCVIGPARAGISKINDIYRYILYIKDADADVAVEIRKHIEADFPQDIYPEVSLQFDLNPLTGY